MNIALWVEDGNSDEIKKIFNEEVMKHGSEGKALCCFNTDFHKRKKSMYKQGPLKIEFGIDYLEEYVSTQPLFSCLMVQKGHFVSSALSIES